MVIRWRYWLTFLFLLFVLSYLREITFLSINATIKGETEFYAKTTEISWLQNYSPANLSKLKVVLTSLFSLLFILFSSLGLKLSFKQKTPLQISLFIYGILIFIAGIIAFSYIFGTTFETIYPILRKLVGWIHNPILFIVISIAFYSMKSAREREN